MYLRPSALDCMSFSMQICTDFSEVCAAMMLGLCLRPIDDENTSQTWCSKDKGHDDVWPCQDALILRETGQVHERLGQPRQACALRQAAFKLQVRPSGFYWAVLAALPAFASFGTLFLRYHTVCLAGWPNMLL